jgi:hypothetical protein
MDNVTALDQHSATITTVVRRLDETADLATRHKHGVSSLLSSREDLRGVHAFADVVEESVRWCA